MRSATCSKCGLVWQCAPRGRIPGMCRTCKKLPDVMREVQLDDAEARRRAGEQRAANLDERLRNVGLHISQHRKED